MLRDDHRGLGASIHEQELVRIEQRSARGRQTVVAHQAQRAGSRRRRRLALKRQTEGVPHLAVVSRGFPLPTLGKELRLLAYAVTLCWDSGKTSGFDKFSIPVAYDS